MSSSWPGSSALDSSSASSVCIRLARGLSAHPRRAGAAHTHEACCRPTSTSIPKCRPTTSMGLRSAQEYHQEGDRPRGRTRDTPTSRWRNAGSTAFQWASSSQRLRQGQGPIGSSLGFVDQYRDGYFIISGPVTLSGTAFELGEASPDRVELITWAAEDAEVWQRLEASRGPSLLESAGRDNRTFAANSSAHTSRSVRCPSATSLMRLRQHTSNPTRAPLRTECRTACCFRADLHDLFDLGLLAVDTSRQSLLLSKELEGTKYEPFNGRRLHLPAERPLWPSADKLDRHRVMAGL